MTFAISVVIPAHNPRPDYLARVLAGLQAQTLPHDRWQLALVDNASEPALRERVDISWHPNAAHVHEPALGLTNARLAGIAATSGDVVVFVDDDNVLAADFLVHALAISEQRPFLGSWSGSVEPDYEDAGVAPPPALHALLTLRSPSGEVWSNDPGHAAAIPWGAGLCVRRAVATAYAQEVHANRARLRLDLNGARMIYGGDTDIAFTGCRIGYGMGVFPALKVTHLIPAARCTTRYLAGVAYGRGYSEVLHGYVLTGAVPRPETVDLRLALRYLRAALRRQPERSAMLAHLRGRRAAIRELSAEMAGR
jgi:glycosyltransferase involved in cell wall biosynthesis